MIELLRTVTRCCPVLKASGRAPADEIPFESEPSSLMRAG